MANGLLSDTSDRIFYIREDKTAVLSYMGETIEFSCEMNEANGTLTLLTEGGKMFIALLDDGTISVSLEYDESGMTNIFAKMEEAAE